MSSRLWCSRNWCIYWFFRSWHGYSNWYRSIFYKISKVDSIVYLVISDGELQEGSTWESMMMAANLDLDNIVCILDHNGSQSFGSTKETHPKFYPIREK